MISLGQASNYRFTHVLRHTCACATRRAYDHFRTTLAQHYHVATERVALYHTGRSALTVALQSVAPHGANVILPGLTCIAVVRAIRAAGCRPVFVDITPDTLEYNYDRLAAKLTALSHQKAQKSPNFTGVAAEKVKNKLDFYDNVCYNNNIILVQNTLGITWQVSKIEKIAHQHHAHIVEDLAHSAGRFYPDGREVGMIGKAVAFSFGKGKAIDTTSGGAVIVRRGALPAEPQRRPRLADRLRDRWYPLLASLCRALWRIRLGQYLMSACVRLGWVRRSADAELDPTRRLTYWQAALAARQFRRLPRTPLREFALVRDRAATLAALKDSGYNLDEIWYDTPVSPARYAEEAAFPAADCPETVRLAASIVNLPTWYPAPRLTRARQIIEEHRL